MKSIVATVNAKVFGTKNGWSLAPIEGKERESTDCEVLLEIQGTKKNGFNLVISPAGFFAADSWHETKQEALESAEELFGVSAESWAPKQTNASI